MEVEGEIHLIVGLVNEKAHQVIGHLQHRRPLGPAGVAAVDGPRQAADEAAELLAVDGLVQKLVVNLELRQRPHQAAVGDAHPPLVVADGDLSRVGLGGAHGHQEDPRPADQLGRLPQAHGVLEAARQLGGRPGLDLEAHRLLEDGGADPVGQGLPQIGDGHGQEVLLVAGDVGAEDAEGGHRILHLAVPEGPRVLSRPHQVLPLGQVEGFLDLRLVEPDDAVGVNVQHPHVPEELHPRLPDGVGQGVVGGDGGGRVVGDAVFGDDLLQFGHEDVHGELFVLAEGAGVGPLHQLPDLIGWRWHGPFSSLPSPSPGWRRPWRRSRPNYRHRSRGPRPR